MLDEFWAFISNRENQATIAWLGGGALVLIGGLWTAFKYFRGRKSQSPAAPSKATTSVETRTSQARADSLAAGRDQIFKGSVTVHQGKLSKSALFVAILGLLLLGFAIWNSGDRTTVKNGNLIEGDMIDGTIDIK